MRVPSPGAGSHRAEVVVWRPVPYRLTSPMRRRSDGTYEQIDWDTAITEIADGLAAIRDAHGGDKIFYYGGGGQGNHLGGAYSGAFLKAIGSRYRSSALAQEKTGEAWVDAQLYGGHTRGEFEHAEVSVFVGKNRNGWRRWATKCTVTRAVLGREFAFDVRAAGIPIARWSYQIEPTEAGCRLTESTWDRRPRWMVPVGGLLTGAKDRAAVNQTNIEATLERIKRRADAA